MMQILGAADGQHFYRTSFLQKLPKRVAAGSTTTVALRVAEGRSHSSFDPAGKTSPLLNVIGATDLVRLGSNITDFTGKPETANKWDSSKPFADLTGIGPKDGLFDIEGKFRTSSVSFHLQQSLFSGFYVQVGAAVSRLVLSNIELKHLGAATVKGVPIANFLATGLPAILNENGFEGGMPTERKKTVWQDPVVSGGWAGSTKRLAPLVSDAAGYMEVGVSLPTAPRKNANRLFDFAAGNNGHFGLVGRVGAEACLLGLVTLGAQAGSTTFIDAMQTVRLATDKAQNGWVALTKARVKEELGSLWDLGGYVSIDKLVTGLRAMVGYSLTRQERTHYAVRDAQYLKTFIDAQRAANPPVLISQDDYANSDSRLKAWEMQAFHAAIQMDTQELFDTAFSGLARIEIAVPLAGKRALKTTMVGGTIGASLVLNY